MGKGINFILILVSVALGSAGQILFKLGVNGVKASAAAAPPMSVLHKIFFYLLAPPVLLGLMCYVISTVLWIYLLSRVPVSWAYPFLGLTYVGVFGLSVLFLGERVTALQLVATGLIGAGVLILAGL